MKVLSISADALGGARAVQTLASLATPGSVVVASELAGVREQLLAAAETAQRGSGEYQDTVDAIRTFHLTIIRELFPAPRQSAVITPLQIILGDLEDILHGVQLLRECSPRTLDLALSFGVRAGCLVVAQYLQSKGLPARREDSPGIRLREAGSSRPAEAGGAGPAPGYTFRNEVVDYPASLEAIRRSLAVHRGSPSPPGDRSGPSVITVVAGGVAGTPEGVPVMLRRDGGDLTAVLIACALEAELVELWTNRGGVTSADPELVEGAFVLGEISYQEAMELSYFGAPMVHPTALVPALEADIPIRVANLATPQGPGTVIRRHPGATASGGSRPPVTGIASIEPAALVNIEGGGMVGVPGIAARVFGALARGAVNIIMISQASSEHSICVVFRQGEAAAALAALRRELEGEIQARLIQNFDLKEDLAILAVIGDNMRGTPGISGRLFSALGREGINILAIAQGSSETNISFVVERAEERRALRVIHRAFLERPAGADRPPGPEPAP
jgi:aspartokinase/homoserine dehydrogenase 1